MIKATFAFWRFLFFFENVHCGSRAGREERFFAFSVGPAHCLQDPQILYSKKKKKTLRLGSTILFTHLKIILLQFFSFQQNKQYLNTPIVLNFYVKTQILLGWVFRTL